MKQDPFEKMRRRNPVPPDTHPTAPHGGADRIIGARVAWPGWAMAAAAAALVVVVGGGTLWLVNRSSETAATDTTSTFGGPTTTAEGTLATTTTSSVPVASTIPPVAVGPEVVVYLMIDDPTATGPSPSLVPVARAVSEVTSIGLPGAAVESLLAGPTAAESASVPALTSAVPVATRLLDLMVADGVATVDLSAAFATGSGSFSEIARIEQLVYTLTRFDDVDGIRLRIEGEPVDLFGSHGIVLDDPEMRTEFDTMLPAILIETPTYGGTAGNPLVATGSANVFEATVDLALTDADGLILWEGVTQATCGTGCRGDWSIEIPYDVGEAQMGALIAWEASEFDGSQTNVREHPVWLVPSDQVPATTTTSIAVPTECSGMMVPSDLVDQPDLPEAVAATRAAVWDAAVECDWEQLGRLLPESGFTYSFGGGTDAVSQWQEEELRGEEPILYLAELLNRPFTVSELEGSTYYSWPSAFGPNWSAVPETDREALRPLYGDEDFAVFDEFGGYIGYRVGILEDGTWLFFVAGD